MDNFNSGMIIIAEMWSKFDTENMNTKKRVLYKPFDDYDRQCIIKCLDKEVFSKFTVRAQFWSRGAVVKRVEHISTIVLVNIWVAQVRVSLVLSVGIWICKNSTINA